MRTGVLLQLASEALALSLWLSAPVLGACLVMGLLSGLLQGATQVQDASLGFVPKLAAAAAALLLGGGWMAHQLVSFTTALWARLGELVS
ncbi:MAG: flagellar biosynthetic protein FliQ [Myxococcales bacterium]|nr:flagellar biosynthetic protein FliQ [Myxococcales bacterium]